MSLTTTDGSRAPSRLSRLITRYGRILPAFVFLGLFFVLPVSMLLGLSFLNSDGALTLEHYQRLWDKPVYMKVLGITLKTAGWTTVLCIIGGYPIAYLLATVAKTTRARLTILVLMPFWTSFLVRTFAWIVLLGRKGAVNNFLMDIGIIDAPIKMIFNFTGVMIGMSHALMPLAVLTMLSVMEGIDKNLSKAGSTMGARGGQTFWRVYFPLSVPGIAAGGMLVFITSLGFFITPALLGGARDTMIVQTIIFQIKEILNWGFAGAIGVLLMVAVLIIFFVYDKLLGLSTLSGGEANRTSSFSKNPIGFVGAQVGGVFTRSMGTLFEWIGIAVDRILPRRADKRRKGGGRIAIWTVGLLMMGFLALPALFIIPVSFTESGFLGWPPQGFSLKWYQSLVETPVWINAAVRSFTVAILASSLGMLLGVPAAFMLARSSFSGKGAVFAFLVSPIIIPNIFIAVGLFFLYAKIGLVGTTIGLVLGHTVLAIPYVVITVLAVVKGYDQNLDMAAFTMGANRRQTLLRVTLPMIRSGMIAAFMFAFIISFDELTIALFVTGGEVTTLPKQMWDDALLRVSPALAAVATLLLLFMSSFILVSEIMKRRADKRG